MKRNQKKKLVLLFIALTICLAGALFIVWKFNKPDVPTTNSSKSTPTSSPQGNNGSEKPSLDNKGQGSQPSGQVQTKSGPAVVSQNYIPAPSGLLLNKHSISLSSIDPSSSPAMNSTCQTVSGASCMMKLSRDGVSRTIGPVVSDSRGGANFEWNAISLGLSSGKWEVVAVATKNGASAQSPADYLEVKP